MKQRHSLGAAGCVLSSAVTRVSPSYIFRKFDASRVLSSNTKQLDKALEQKVQEDVPAFNPPAELRRGQNSRAILEQP
jgi:hypothetical protein